MDTRLLTTVMLLIVIACNRNNERIVSYYENGNAKQVIRYNSSRDTLDQTITEYFPKGNIKSKCKVVNGILEGHYESYFESGNIYMLGNYKNNFRNGEWEIWNSKGDKFIRNFRNDTLHGSTREVRHDGSVVFGEYFDGKELGQWITKNKDSIVTMITTYDNGQLNGPVSEFYQTGNIYVEGLFLNGQKTGEWKIYGPKGSIDTVEVYENDRLIQVLY